MLRLLCSLLKMPSAGNCRSAPSAADEPRRAEISGQQTLMLGARLTSLRSSAGATGGGGEWAGASSLPTCQPPTPPGLGLSFSRVVCLWRRAPRPVTRTPRTISRRHRVGRSRKLHIHSRHVQWQEDGLQVTGWMVHWALCTLHSWHWVLHNLELGLVILLPAGKRVYRMFDTLMWVFLASIVSKATV